MSQDLLTPLETGRKRVRKDHKTKSAAELGVKLGKWIWKREGKGEDLQSGYLLSWPASNAFVKNTLFQI